MEPHLNFMIENLFKPLTMKISFQRSTLEIEKRTSYLMPSRCFRAVIHVKTFSVDINYFKLKIIPI